MFITDDDDCSYVGRCHQAAECIDLFGGWTCKCPEYMSGDGFEYCGTFSLINNYLHYNTPAYALTWLSINNQVINNLEYLVKAEHQNNNMLGGG